MLILKTNLTSKFSVTSVAFITLFFLCGKYQLSKYNLFEKTNPILCVFWAKNHDSAKFKANSNPIQTQFLALFNYKNSVCSVTSVAKFYTFLCKTNPNSLVFSPKTAILPKNEPKQSQLVGCQNERISFIDRAL